MVGPGGVPVDARGGALSPSTYVSLKRAELVESPPTRMMLKDFHRQLRAKERESFRAAHDFALTTFARLPPKIHWRVLLELAELAKRENRVQHARLLFTLVTERQPFASQGWLEFAKLEDECGELERCRHILILGLQHCEGHEGLLTKAIKHEERLGNLSAARELLSRLRGVSLERSWRTLLEGALLEARTGNTSVARKVFRYLIKNVPWYGPIYYEAFRFEEKNGHEVRALRIIEKGVREIPRYGPLWFGALRLYEKLETREFVSMRLRDRVRAAMQWDPPASPSETGVRRRSRTASSGDGGDGGGGSGSADDGGKAGAGRIGRERGDSGSGSAATPGPGPGATPGATSPQSGEATPASAFAPKLTRTRRAVTRATLSISKELVWKVHFEAAQIEERAAETCLATAKTTAEAIGNGEYSLDDDDGFDDRGAATSSHGREGRRRSSHRSSHRRRVVETQRRVGLAAQAAAGECLQLSRQAYVQSALHCPANLRWKVWLAGARMELSVAGKEAVARALLERALLEVPAKSRAQVLLEQARTDEYVGAVERARGTLRQARAQTSHEWKVFLESVLLERRAGNRDAAVAAAEAALEVHTGTGRLWAVLVQLRREDGFKRQLQVFRAALDEVPKSGEVWCEGARIHMEPLSPFFDLTAATAFLEFAIQFTPQYGDSFVEYVRVALLREALRFAAEVERSVEAGARIKARARLASEGGGAAPAAATERGNTDAALESKRSRRRDGARRGRRSRGDGDGDGDSDGDGDGGGDGDDGSDDGEREGKGGGAPHDSDGDDADADEDSGSDDTADDDFDASLREMPIRDLRRRLRNRLMSVSVSSIERRCINADPNYGGVWFHCKRRPFDTARKVLRRAHAQLCVSIASAFERAPPADDAGAGSSAAAAGDGSSGSRDARDSSDEGAAGAGSRGGAAAPGSHASKGKGKGKGAPPPRDLNEARLADKSLSRLELFSAGSGIGTVTGIATPASSRRAKRSALPGDDDDDDTGGGGIATMSKSMRRKVLFGSDQIMP